MPKKTFKRSPDLVTDLVTVFRTVPGATVVNPRDPLGGALWALAMLIGASKEKDLVKAAERAASEAGIPVELADGLVSVAYAFVEAMAEARGKANANTRNAAEA